MRDKVSTLQVLTFVLAVLVIVTGVYVWKNRDAVKATLEITEAYRNLPKDKLLELEENDPEFVWKSNRVGAFMRMEGPTKTQHRILEVKKDSLVVENIWKKKFEIPLVKIIYVLPEPYSQKVQGQKMLTLLKTSLKPGYIVDLWPGPRGKWFLEIYCPLKADTEIFAKIVEGKI